MNRKIVMLLATVSAFAPVSVAMAAADYYLVIDGVDGEASGTAEVLSWSWGMTKSGTARNAQGTAASGDMNGDGRPDLAAAAAQDEIQGFSLTLDGASPLASMACAKGKHFAKADLHARQEVLTLEDVTITDCTTATQPAGAASHGMPHRMSMNMTVPKQTQGATFGERCASGHCAEPASVTVSLTGRMRDFKKGHVTLIK